MYYIGISAYYHESSVFLTNNEDVNCFLKEESFSRIKGDKNFPKRSLKFLIKKFELKKENITKGLQRLRIKMLKSHTEKK